MKTAGTDADANISATEEVMSIEELEENVTKAYHAKETWKSMRKRGLIPYTLEMEIKLTRELVKSEDDLAHARFGKMVRDEWERIKSAVDAELERIDGLQVGGEKTSLYDLCALCGEDLSNDLVLVEKHGHGQVRHSMLYCCGRKLCYSCNERSNPYKGIEKRIEELEKKGGVMMIQDPGKPRCPNCNRFPLSGDKKLFKAAEEFADQGIPWAMDDLSLAFSRGKHGRKKNPQKAKTWLLKAAKENSSQAQYHLGECYSSGGDTPFGNFPQSYSDAFKYYSAAADQGFAAACVQLAGMYRNGRFVEKDSRKALEYASLAVYQQEEQLGGRDCWEMFTIYHDIVPEFQKRRSPSSKVDLPIIRDHVIFDLAFYWGGRALEVKGSNPDYGQVLSGMFAMYAAEPIWFKHTHGTNIFPGFSPLPLARRLEIKYGIKEPSSPFISHFKGLCAHAPCRKQNDGSFKVCAGCKVFYYCGKDCQRKHWSEGHKRECNGDHWIKEFLPKL